MDWVPSNGLTNANKWIFTFHWNIDVSLSPDRYQFAFAIDGKPYYHTINRTLFVCSNWTRQFRWFIRLVWLQMGASKPSRCVKISVCADVCESIINAVCLTAKYSLHVGRDCPVQWINSTYSKYWRFLPSPVQFHSHLLSFSLSLYPLHSLPVNSFSSRLTWWW